MKTKDISKIYRIINDKIYNNDFALKKELLGLSDDKLIKGLIVELHVKEEIYKLKMAELSDFANILYGSEQNIDELLDCHDYYISKLIEDPYVQLMTYFDVSQEEFPEAEFIDWAKSLSNIDVEHIESMCIEYEEYEYIGIVIEIRNRFQ